MVARFLALLVAIFGSSLLITTIYAVSCGPGTFVNSTHSGCERCPNGTFTSQTNSPSCSNCKSCEGKHNRISQQCTSTTNTKCECEPGYFFSGFLICLKCSPCRRGMGLKRNCTATSDTVCESCEKGRTFSNGKNFERCKPCSRCQKGEIVNKECTRRKNTKCTPERDMNGSKRVFTVPPKPTVTGATTGATSNTSLRRTTRKNRLKSSSKPSSTVSANLPSATSLKRKQDNLDSEEEQTFEIILYVLIGFLVLLLVAVAVFFVRRRKKHPVKRGKPDNAEEPSTRTNSTEVIGAVENPYSSLPFIGGRQGGDKMLRDVPYTLITDLSQYLNPGDRWKQLGGRLNFNSTQINNFAVDRGKSTEVMLQEWSQRENATVVALKNTFKTMKWSKEERIVGAYV